MLQEHRTTWASSATSSCKFATYSTCQENVTEVNLRKTEETKERHGFTAPSLLVCLATWRCVAIGWKSRELAPSAAGINSPASSILNRHRGGNAPALKSKKCRKLRACCGASLFDIEYATRASENTSLTTWQVLTRLHLWQ